MTIYLTPIDKALKGINELLNTLAIQPKSQRAYPGKSEDHPELTLRDKELATRYMRINHVGEICAQALYQSQAITARETSTQEAMTEAAREEQDHLSWCETRLKELGGRTSYLNPIWYAGSFAIGLTAGLAGDKWNLGFVAETEKQVVAHLDEHLVKLPEKDQRSREVVEQMKQDEQHHSDQAIEAGAAELPKPIKTTMQLVSTVMTKTAYWL